MNSSSNYRVGILPRDGIGKEVMEACLGVLDKVQNKIGGFSLSLQNVPAGEGLYLEEGINISVENMNVIRTGDSYLLEQW